MSKIFNDPFPEQRTGPQEASEGTQGLGSCPIQGHLWFPAPWRVPRYQGQTYRARKSQSTMVYRSATLLETRKTHIHTNTKQKISQGLEQ